LAIVVVIATLNAFLRDLDQLVRVFLLLLFYVTPVLYPVSMVPKNLEWLLLVNPFSPLIISWRALLVDNLLSPYIGVASAYAFLSLLIEFPIYRKMGCTIRWYNGLLVTMYLGNNLSRCLYGVGTYEPNEFMFLSGVLQPGMIFVDVGANDGLYRLFAAKRLGPSGRVVALEPSGREFARLERNLQLNRLPRLAASDRDGLATLRIAGFGHEGARTRSERSPTRPLQEGDEQVRPRCWSGRLLRISVMVISAQLPIQRHCVDNLISTE
jgi:FkbM family methyltransferase